MPVVTLYYKRLETLLRRNLSSQEIVDKIPYLGLDIEETAEDWLRIEYSPNRPDFSTDYGVARALNGFIGAELSSPEYHANPPRVTVQLEDSVMGVRPCFSGAVALGITLDDETIRQIITTQEDLHTGIGRRRSKVSIGIHNLDAIKPPLRYFGAGSDFVFTPLNERRLMSVADILHDTETGRAYGEILKDTQFFPMITDSNHEVLSFPPIINGELTRITPETKNLFIDVTGTSQEACDQALAVLSAALIDAGAILEQVLVSSGRVSRTTPSMAPRTMRVDSSLARRLLGLRLTDRQISQALMRSRISVKKVGDHLEAAVPPYRIDILHPVDLVEEIALGFDVSKITATLPPASRPGAPIGWHRFLDAARVAMAGLGFIEVINSSLVSSNLAGMGDSISALQVENPKSIENEYLRGHLLPSLLYSLAENIHQPYPQRIFEIGTTFAADPNSPTSIREELKIAVVIAHPTANFTEAKSIVTTLLKGAYSLNCELTPSAIPLFIEGRSASLEPGGGWIGEVDPSKLEEFQLRVPVSGFELSLSRLPGFGDVPRL
jgi:phenylalanyl-tRNA synthetase beta chain